MLNFLIGVVQVVAILVSVWGAIYLLRRSGNTRTDDPRARGDSTTTMAHLALLAFLPVLVLTNWLWGPLSFGRDVNNPGRYWILNPWNPVFSWLPVMSWRLWLVLIVAVVLCFLGLTGAVRIAGLLLVLLAILGIDFQDPWHHIFGDKPAEEKVQTWDDMTCGWLRQELKSREEADAEARRAQREARGTSLDAGERSAAAVDAASTELQELKDYIREDSDKVKGRARCIPEIPEPKVEAVAVGGRCAEFRVMGAKGYELEFDLDDPNLPDYVHEGYNQQGTFTIDNIRRFQYCYTVYGPYEPVLHWENRFGDSGDVGGMRVVVESGSDGRQVANRPRPDPEARPDREGPTDCAATWRMRPTNGDTGLVARSLQSIQDADTEAGRRVIAWRFIQEAKYDKLSLSAAVSNMLGESIAVPRLVDNQGRCASREAARYLSRLKHFVLTDDNIWQQPAAEPEQVVESDVPSAPASPVPPPAAPAPAPAPDHAHPAPAPAPAPGGSEPPPADDCTLACNSPLGDPGETPRPVS